MKSNIFFVKKISLNARSNLFFLNKNHIMTSKFYEIDDDTFINIAGIETLEKYTSSTRGSTPHLEITMMSGKKITVYVNNPDNESKEDIDIWTISSFVYKDLPKVLKKFTND